MTRSHQPERRIPRRVHPMQVCQFLLLSPRPVWAAALFSGEQTFCQERELKSQLGSSRMAHTLNLVLLLREQSPWLAPTPSKCNGLRYFLLFFFSYLKYWCLLKKVKTAAKMSFMWFSSWWGIAFWDWCGLMESLTLVAKQIETTSVYHRRIHSIVYVKHSIDLMCWIQFKVCESLTFILWNFPQDCDKWQTFYFQSWKKTVESELDTLVKGVTEVCR